MGPCSRTWTFPANGIGATGLRRQSVLMMPSSGAELSDHHHHRLQQQHCHHWGHIKCEVRNCDGAKLTTYNMRNENAKLNICVEITAENERSVYSERENVKQSVTNDDCVTDMKCFRIFSRFTRCRVSTFAVSHFAFYSCLSSSCSPAGIVEEGRAWTTICSSGFCGTRITFFMLCCRRPKWTRNIQTYFLQNLLSIICM